MPLTNPVSPDGKYMIGIRRGQALLVPLDGAGQSRVLPDLSPPGDRIAQWSHGFAPSLRLSTGRATRQSLAVRGGDGPTTALEGDPVRRRHQFWSRGSRDARRQSVGLRGRSDPGRSLRRRRACADRHREPVMRRSPGDHEPRLARRARAVAPVLMFLALAVRIEVGGAGAQGSGLRWTGTWAAAPQPFLPGSLQTFRNQTIRLIVHTSIGGTRLRIRFSNTYGDRPVIFGGAHVARRTAGPGIARLRPGRRRLIRALLRRCRYGRPPRIRSRRRRSVARHFSG